METQNNSTFFFLFAAFLAKSIAQRASEGEAVEDLLHDQREIAHLQLVHLLEDIFGRVFRR
jgi:hypothetical protein